MDNEVFIRQAQISDVKAIARVIADSWKAAYGELISDDDMKLFTNLPRREDMLKSRLLKGDIIYVIILKGEITGVCSSHRYESDDFTDTAEIDQLYLAPSAIGNGMGGRLLRFALNSFLQIGFKRAVLFVMEGNIRAEGFYGHMGFHADGFYLVCENLSGKNRAFRYIKELI